MRLHHALGGWYGAMKSARCLSWLSLVCMGAAGNVPMLPYSFRYQPDQNLSSCKKEKSDSMAVELEPGLELSSCMEPMSPEGTPGIAKGLCMPMDTTPTLRSGRIVYGCASLLGDHWDFTPWAFGS